MFKALMLTRDGKTVHAAVTELDEAVLGPGDVTVRVEYSTLNFKDGLAITGRGAIVKNWPLIAGIDLAGTVEASESAAWKPGDQVVINGWGLGETHHGGLAQKARVSSGWLLAVPAPYSTRDTMALGTAGYTAALCVQALLRHGVKPTDGPVLVTGASGGVGIIAVRLLAGLGFEVDASTGRPQHGDALRAMGATHLVDRAELAAPGKPLQSERWAGVVDAVGSHTLVNACARTKWNGAVAACGLAQGADLPGTVLPFILRGVTLYGINSVYVPEAQRREAWALLAAHVSPQVLAGLGHVIGLSEAIPAAADLLDGRITGRVVVDVNR
ncbi:MAG: oxidoreductase [Rubrivivax sp.]|nr:oxidoreductase [Rubrivivax sp.]